jgi:hypothetical protein
MINVEHVPGAAGLVRRAVNLLVFMRQTHQLRVKPVRSVDTFDKALWVGDLSEPHAMPSAHRTANPDVDAPLLRLDRVPKFDPELIAGLQSWRMPGSATSRGGIRRG